MTFQATLLAAALALVPAFARADDAKKSDTQQAPGQMDHASMKLTDDKVLRKLHHVNLEEVRRASWRSRRARPTT